eukprot:TRINITY_DN1607_c1_g1_i2.p1 TRINITY_DN1607_c1_g1~~TRINITY_DN1607_c1_g1_i2.p1  ORF type:complete len:208 (+),score=86.24 TRINITY_DN1607_c1_g1_i2:210-833(+)
MKLEKDLKQNLKISRDLNEHQKQVILTLEQQNRELEQKIQMLKLKNAKLNKAQQTKEESMNKQIQDLRNQIKNIKANDSKNEEEYRALTKWLIETSNEEPIVERICYANKLYDNLQGKSWKTRLFLLSPKSLIYYLPEERPKPRKNIPLTLITRAVQDRENPKCMRFLFQQGNWWTIEFETPEICADWLQDVERMRDDLRQGIRTRN